VLWTFVLVYVASALVTTVVVFLASRWAGDERRPPTHRVGLSIAAGIVWPVLLLGIVELGSIAMYAKVAEHEPGIDVRVE